MDNNNQLIQHQPQAVQNTGFDFFNVTQFETVQRVSKMFALSELVPEMYRVSATNSIDKAMANCMIALDMSSRIGASPLMIMQNLVIIYGRPSWSSKFLIATVNTCGRFETLKYKFKDLGMIGKIKLTSYTKGQGANTTDFDGTHVQNIECIAYTTAKGSEEILESSPITIRMALDEGWYTKAGSKWRTIAKQMLMYRAASFWTSAYAPELSMGMKTVEEVEDFTDYEEIPTVKEQVKDKINENANKQTVDFKTEPEPTVDPAKVEPAAADTKKTPDAKAADKLDMNKIGQDNQKAKEAESQATPPADNTGTAKGNALFPE